MQAYRKDETEFVTLEFTTTELWILLMALNEQGEPPSAEDVPRYNELREHLSTAIHWYHENK